MIKVLGALLLLYSGAAGACSPGGERYVISDVEPAAIPKGHVVLEVTHDGNYQDFYRVEATVVRVVAGKFRGRTVTLVNGYVGDRKLRIGGSCFRVGFRRGFVLGKPEAGSGGEPLLITVYQPSWLGRADLFPYGGKPGRD